MPAIIPSLDEQQIIARFLDYRTAQLHRLIAKKRQLLDKLAEKRSALITRAVTRGLDPHAPMKDSGVPWLGEIPVHWEATRLKFVTEVESGHTPNKNTPEFREDCDIPWVSLNDSKQLARSDYIERTAVSINARGLAASSARMLPAGCVVFTRDATVGLAAIAKCPLAVSQHLIAWLPSVVLRSEYLLFVIYAMADELERLTFGATVKTIGMGDIMYLSTPIPPSAEQNQIVEYVRSQSEYIDGVTERVRSAITRLTEYRSALITAAVTGQIDVRGWRQPEAPAA